MFACITADDRAERLLAIAQSFSPRVETRAAAVILDLTGLERLLGSPAEIANRISAQAQHAGLHVNIAVASNADVAICAARAYAGITVVSPGKERALLGHLPLGLLDPPEEMSQTFRQWGLHTFQDLAALPEIALAERLGDVAVQLQRRARGVLQQAMLPDIAAPQFVESLELDYPVMEIEPLMFVLAGLLQTLCASLVSYGVAAQELHLHLRLEKGTHERMLRLPWPMRDSKGLLKLLQLDLETNPPAAAIVVVTIRAIPAPPRSLQHGLFVPAVPDPEKLEITLARITRLVGAENVGSPVMLDTHRADAFRMEKFQLPGQSSARPAAARVEALAMRRYRPPLPARVRTIDGKPDHVSARGISGPVTMAAGPWKTGGEWWRDTKWSHDEWDVAVGEGIYRIYQDHLAQDHFAQDHIGKRWFVEGMYD